MNLPGMRCAFLTMADEGDFVTDYSLAIAPLEALGCHVEVVTWHDDSIAWDDYDAVYIAAPWDYPGKLAAFLQTLARIESSTAILVNEFRLVKWNLDKAYLGELEQGGVAIVPTVWCEDFDAGRIERAFEELRAERIVIKPRVGANAADIHVLAADAWRSSQDSLAQLYDRRAHMLQPFLPSIKTTGEYSLFYFGGEFSHAIRKVPAAGDFRVQEEHGAEILSASPSAALASAGAAAIARIPGRACYARADFVQNAASWQIMELELVEPSLYLRMDPGAPARFAQALIEHVRATV